MTTTLETLRPPKWSANGHVGRVFLGQGAFKRAYRVTHKHERRTAIQFIGPKAEQAFFAERKGLECLNKLRPLGCRAPEVYLIAEDHHLIIREYFPRTLKDCRRHPGDERRLLQFACDLAHDLSCLHGQELLYRDFKRENIAVARDGRAVLMDLGSIGDQATAATILTRAPEQLHGAPPSKQTDVWGLAALKIAIWTGRYPFVSHRLLRERERYTPQPVANDSNDPAYRAWRTDFDQRIALSSEDQVSLQQLIQKSFPSDVAELLLQMLAPDPSHRPSMEECSRHFQELLSHRRLASRRAA